MPSTTIMVASLRRGAASPAHIARCLRRCAVLALLLIATTAYSQPPSAEEQAQGLLRERKFDEAAAAYGELVRQNPYSGNAWSQLGFCLHSAKQYEKALPAFQKAVDLGFGRPTNLYNCACASALLGRQDDALSWLEKALKARFAEQETLESDTDLDSLRGQMRFAELTGIIKGLPTGPAEARDDGWRWDLDFCQRRMEQMHWDLYAKSPKTEFDAEIESLKSDVPRLSDDQIRVRLRRIIAAVGDGHTASRLFAEGAPMMALPLHLFAFKEGLFVIGADPAHEALLGAEVLTLGSLTADAALKAVRPYISADNEMGYLAQGPQLLRMAPILEAIGVDTKQGVRLGLRNSLGEKSETLVEPVSREDGWHQGFFDQQLTYLHERQTASPHYLKERGQPLRLESIPDRKLLYFWFGAVMAPPSSTFKDFVLHIFDVMEKESLEHLVIDMRFNGGGNTNLVQPLLHEIIRHEKVNQRGRLWVIIGRHTFSAAQNTVNLLDRETKATFVGEPTGSRPAFVGESTWFVLPHSRTRVFCSSRYWQYMDSTDERIWIPPDVVAEPTFADYAAGKDPAMEAILRSLNESH